MSESCGTSDVPELTRHEGAHRDAWFGHALITEEPVFLIAKVVPLQIGIGANQCTAIWSRFQAWRLALRCHVKADGFSYHDQKLPFGIKRIRLGEHPVFERHGRNVALRAANLFEQAF